MTIQAQVLELIKELTEASKASVIMITHDLGVVASLCNKIIIMYGGKIVEAAVTNPRTQHSLYSSENHLSLSE